MKHKWIAVFCAMAVTVSLASCSTGDGGGCPAPKRGFILRFRCGFRFFGSFAAGRIKRNF